MTEEVPHNDLDVTSCECRVVSFSVVEDYVLTPSEYHRCHLPYVRFKISYCLHDRLITSIHWRYIIVMKYNLVECHLVRNFFSSSIIHELDL